ncbi:MAG TPA: hypothetical protein VFH48_12995 [Chloroflexota bacterium]|nr:hypothetical protein [Chloroflexota bacterium]
MQDQAAPTIDSPAEFERVLGLGLGRAILFLRQHDARPYRDIILNACVHWTGYDQQVEGTRTPYLMTVLDETGQIESYVESILAAFRSTTDRRDQQQLIRLASELAQDGYAEARVALYERFDRNDSEEPYSCAVELLRQLGELPEVAVVAARGEQVGQQRPGRRLRGGRPSLRAEGAGVADLDDHDCQRLEPDRDHESDGARLVPAEVRGLNSTDGGRRSLTGTRGSLPLAFHLTVR